jgi:signal transduction histidine kinase
MPPSQVVGDHHLRQLNILRFALPIVLFLVANGFELHEHWGEIVLFNVQLLGEILIFGLLGPVLVFTWLSYIGVLMKRLALANQRMATLNQSLEQQVADRTATLGLRNRELAAANADLAHKNQELRQLDQLKSDFVALVSHELRAPLTNLNGAVEMTLHAQHELPDPTRRLLEVIGAESKRLTNFVQTILDLSRLEAGRIKFNPGLVAVRPVLARNVAATLGHTDRPIKWWVEGQIPPVWADEIYLEQVLRNLLVNADKYTPAGSPIEIAIATSADVVQIDITDHGPGIPAEAQGHIFDRFYRQPSGDGGVKPGWGLGLYFARALTEAQGGRLMLTSPVRNDDECPGARFSIVLPLAKEMDERD